MGIGLYFFLFLKNTEVFLIRLLWILDFSLSIAFLKWNIGKCKWQWERQYCYYLYSQINLWVPTLYTVWTICVRTISGFRGAIDSPYESMGWIYHMKKEYDKNLDIRFILNTGGQNFTSEVRDIKYNKNILNCSLWTNSSQA